VDRVLDFAPRRVERPATRPVVDKHAMVWHIDASAIPVDDFFRHTLDGALLDGMQVQVWDGLCDEAL